MSGSVSMVAGKPSDLAPTIHWWADVSDRSIILRAKHSGSSSDQAVVIVERDATGNFVVSSRSLFDRKLCAALGADIGHCLPASKEARK